MIALRQHRRGTATFYIKSNFFYITYGRTYLWLYTFLCLPVFQMGFYLNYKSIQARLTISIFVSLFTKMQKTRTVSSSTIRKK